jgi:hypothetical protein
MGLGRRAARPVNQSSLETKKEIRIWLDIKVQYAAFADAKA